VVHMQIYHLATLCSQFKSHFQVPSTRALKNFLKSIPAQISKNDFDQRVNFIIQTLAIFLPLFFIGIQFMQFYLRNGSRWIQKRKS
jgi:hypothetical protein